MKSKSHHSRRRNNNGEVADITNVSSSRAVQSLSLHDRDFSIEAERMRKRRRSLIRGLQKKLQDMLRTVWDKWGLRYPHRIQQLYVFETDYVWILQSCQRSKYTLSSAKGNGCSKCALIWIQLIPHKRRHERMRTSRRKSQSCHKTLSAFVDFSVSRLQMIQLS